MARSLVIHRTAERPDLKMWLEDDDGTLINFASGYSFSFKLGSVGSAAAFTKTSGISGAAGAGEEPDGTPNITVTFSAAELDSLTPGATTGQLTATSSSLDRVFQFPVQVRNVIT
jgi:hypothetical protein